MSGSLSLLAPIDPRHVSFDDVRQDLLAWAQNKPGGMAWTDWLSSDDGTIIAEWIAGLATFRKVAEIMRQRETSLDYAQQESSIYNLAFDRGLLVTPSNVAVTTLTLATTASAQSPLAVTPGQLVGMQGTYDLFSLEGKTLHPADTLRCAVAHMTTFTPVFSTLAPFSMFDVLVPDRYIAIELESFVADGVPIPLVAEPNSLAGQTNTFLLRRVLPGEVRLYVGNGTLGWYKPTVASIAYTCLSYGQDVTAALAYTPTLAIDATLVSFAQTQTPSFDPDKETLRAITRYYPLDGRIVQDGDYEATIRKYYGGVLYDVFSYNSDPDQQVHLLPNPSYGAGAQAANQLANITATVDAKRGLGIDVIYTVVDPASGQELDLTFQVTPASAYSYDLQRQVNDITTKQLFQFVRDGARTYSAVAIATQLSARFGVQMTPADPTISLTLLPTDFLKTFTVGLTT